MTRIHGKKQPHCVECISFTKSDGYCDIQQTAVRATTICPAFVHEVSGKPYKEYEIAQSMTNDPLIASLLYAIYLQRVIDLTLGECIAETITSYDLCV